MTKTWIGVIIAVIVIGGILFFTNNNKKSGDTTMDSTNTSTSTNESTGTSSSSNMVVLHTEKGDITIELLPAIAPKTVANFLNLVGSGFYGGTRFHRVIAGFMIQGGDPLSKDVSKRAMWGTGGSGTNIPAEFNDLSHTRGIVSMARSDDPNSASSQFFIVVKDSTFLDHQYTAFGRVVSGMEVADEIVIAGGGKELPDNPIILTKAELK